MIAAILSTGTELTRGELVNTNASWLAAELSLLGVEVTTIDTVDDHVGRIAGALRRLSFVHDLVVCTGGLGPTTDDLTAEAVSQAATAELRVHEPSLLSIKARLARLGRELTPSNAKQALLPLGSDALANPHGTAPGFALSLNRARIYCLPGVPGEMKPMFESHVAPALAAGSSKHVAQVVLRSVGAAESIVNDRLQGIEAAFGVTLGYRVHFPELAIKVIARDTSIDAATQLAERAAAHVQQLLGNQVIFGRGNDTLAAVVAAILRARGQRLAIAESCTGGLVSVLLACVPGISDIFSGSVVAYANQVKRDLLGVPGTLLDSVGAVSGPVALAMAEGVRSRMESEWGIAITGIAGPTGATPDRPLGTVHFAIVGPGVSHHHHRVLRWERERFQRLASFLVLNWLRCLLEDKNVEML